ncbi:MAG: choice-of-anchor J domain-containing protein, partial [Methylococcales bacterium]|nr:choice-of-anchor J domain-containing protein [Methylococcales bacterium]
MANAGMSTIDITGTFGITTAHTTVDLTVSAAAPGGTTLTSPADGATNIANPPTLQWTATAGASSYLVEVATDAGFSNIVYSATVNGTSTNASGLATGTQYYWRVTASNGCGAGTASSTYSFTTESAPGDCSAGTTAEIVYSEDFEGGEGSWTHDSATGPDTSAHGAANGNGSAGFHATNVDEISDQRLTSPMITLPTGQSPLTFQFANYQEMEADTATACYDGGILEVSADGSTWTQLENELLTDPYNGPLDGGFNNPLIGSNAWCGDPQEWLNSIVDVDAYAGQTVQFRLRLGTDASVSRPGWNIDDVKVQSCAPSAAPSIVLTATVGTTNSCDATDMTTLPAGGGVAYYCYSVENTGDVTFANHIINDSVHGQ